MLGWREAAWAPGGREPLGLLGLDLVGTGSVKALLLDEDGAALGGGSAAPDYEEPYARYRRLYPRLHR